MAARKKIEADLSQAMSQFHKEYLGSGPEETKVVLLANLVLFRCRKVLSPQELRLLQRSDLDGNRALVKQVRRELMEQHREHLEAAVSAVLGRPIRSLYYDTSTVADDCVIVLILGEPIDRDEA